MTTVLPGAGSIVYVGKQPNRAAVTYTASVVATSDYLSYAVYNAAIVAESDYIVYRRYEGSVIAESDYLIYKTYKAAISVVSDLATYSSYSASIVAESDYNVWVYYYANATATSDLTAYTEYEAGVVSVSDYFVYQDYSATIVAEADLLVYEDMYAVVIAESDLLVSDTFFGWAMNLTTGAISKFDNYNFNSLTMTLGADKEGIHYLYGDTDNGAAIAGLVETGKLDHDVDYLKRVTDVYLSKDGGKAKLTVSTENSTEVTYRFRSTDKLEPIKANAAKGAKGKYWQYKLENVAGSVFETDEIEVVVQPLSRRI